MNVALGQHGILDVFGCQTDVLMDVELLSQALQQAANSVGAHILHTHLHHFGQGQGVTGVVLLAESHISIHTWPEYAFAAIDVFLCGDMQPEKALRFLQQALKAQEVAWQVLPRGQSLLSAPKS